MENVLVTGASGFIGSHLIRKLLENGDEVVGIDNFSTGKRENIQDLMDNPNFTFVEIDICNPVSIESPLSQIYNLACPASPIGYNRLPLETLAVCSSGVLNILNIALKNNARFLQTSTSEVYGDPKEHPQKESYWGNVNSIGPRSCYDEGKRFAESLIVNFSRIKGVDAKIVRIFNTYGPRMDPLDGRVIVNMLKQALSGEPVTVYGDGSQTRSFCFVSDQVDGLYKMMNSNERGPINIGNPKEFTILELAENILRITGSESKIVFLPLPKDDPTRRKPDITLAKSRLNWEPLISLEEGLRLTIPFLKNQLGL